MLTLVDGEVTAKVADFGLAKPMYLESTVRSTKGGSTRWRSPECYCIPTADGSGDLTAPKFSEKSDVWSCGMLIYEILTTLVRACVCV